MYRIERKYYGYKMYFSGDLTHDELKYWDRDCAKLLLLESGTFSITMDLRNVSHFEEGTILALSNTYKGFKRQGLIRAAIVVKDDQANPQISEIHQQFGWRSWDRIINALEVIDWAGKAERWNVLKREPIEQESRGSLFATAVA